MKKIKNHEKIGKIVIGMVFILTGIFLFSKNQYGYGILIILALLLVYKIDSIVELVYNITDGFSVKFKTSPSKVEENIKENEEPITNKNFISFRKIESKVLSDLQKRYGGEMKTLVHFAYGQPDKPDFFYTPDGSLQTEDTLYFFEIKYIIKPELAKKIITNSLNYLKTIHSKLLPVIGDKKFVIKLVLTSWYDLSHLNFNTPDGIEIEFYKL